MSRSFLLGLLFLCSLGLFGFDCPSGAEPASNITHRRHDDRELVAARATARKEWPKFEAAFKEKQGKDFSVKAPFTEDNRVEHMWITVQVIKDNRITGTINTDPVSVTNVKFGQQVSVPVSEIDDWMISGNDKLSGGFQSAVLKKRMNN